MLDYSVLVLNKKYKVWLNQTNAERLQQLGLNPDVLIKEGEENPRNTD